MGDQIRIPCVAKTFFPFPFPRRYYGLQNCHPFALSFLLFVNFFFISPWPYCVYLFTWSYKKTVGHVVRILLNSLDCWSFKTFNHGLKSPWSIRKFIQLVNFVTFSVLFFFFGNRIWLNLYHERAPASIYKNIRARIYSMQCISAIRYWIEFKE